MSAMQGFCWLNAPAWLPLVHALLHTLWQGALAAGGLFLALRLVPARRADRRYGLSLAALTLVLLLGVGSWALLDTPPSPLPGTMDGRRPPTAIAGNLADRLPVSPAAALAPVERQQAVRAAEANPILATADISGLPKAWVQRVAVCWLLGVAASLLRAAKGAFGAGRLRRRCRDLSDPRILALMEELRRRLGLSRRVRLLVSAEIGVPSVMGVLWPAVLLPASMLTGVPTEQLRAILAHELAHIRRWDYLVNLAQMLVEALLFFNPFVWWISRQVRVEREACCDQLAASECRSPASYVEALVAVIEHNRPANAASPILAASGPAPHGGAALDRARRLLIPGYQPALRLRWFSLATVLTLSGLALSGLWLGTRAVAQTIKMTEQKPEPKKADEQPGGTRAAAAYQVKVVTADGSPLGDNQAVVHNHSQFVNSGTWVAHAVESTGLYTVNVPANTNTESVAATKEGYATIFAGPFTPQNMDKLNGLELTLTRGHPAAIETVDEAGHPVADALLSARYPGPPEVACGDAKTDASGLAKLEHLANAPLDVRVRADGYQADEIKNVPLDPAKPYRWTLKKTSALRGTVTAAATGQAIVGAVVRLAYARGLSDEDHLWPGSGPVLATTDAQGGLTLGSLRPDSHYWFYVDAPGYGGVYVSDVTLAQGELKVALGPEIMIRGKIIHLPPSAIHGGKVTLKYNQTFAVKLFESGTAGYSVDLTPVNGEADFSVGPFYKAYPEAYSTTPNAGGSMRWWHTSVTLAVDGWPPAAYVPGDPLATSFVLDLAEKPSDTAAAAPDAKTAGNTAPASNAEPRSSNDSTAVPSTPGAPPPPSSPAPPGSLPNDALAAAREGNAKQALSLLEASLKPKKFGAEDATRTLDGLIRARELRAFTTLYDLLRHFYAKDWKLSDELLAALVKDERTDFLDALIVRRFDLNRLTRAAESAEPTAAGWITHRVTEVTGQQADVAALCQAAADNDLPALQRLVDAGSDVNGVGEDDNTPLIRAVFKNRLEAARFLLDHGAQVDKPRLPGWNYTPLCLVNSVPMAELLKKYGADVHAKLYERNESILTYAAMWAKGEVVAWFLKQGLDAGMIDDHHQNLLFGLKDGATAEALLEAGTDPNQTDEFGHTPLTAAQSGEVARALIRHGANLKPRLKDGATLLEYAVVNTRREDNTPQEDAAYIEELIKQGAEFDPKGNGVKAMISAAFSDRVGEVRVFLDHGVSPNAQDDRGPYDHRSALSSAAWQAPETLKLLLARGADPNAPLPAGEPSPLSTALIGLAFGNADLLRAAGAKGVSDLAYYSVKGDAAKVSELLDQHADPNEADSSGQTPLDYAVQHAEVEVAKRLLAHGASVDQFNAWGFSPYLNFALYQQMIEGDSSQAQQQWRLAPQEATARLAAFQQLFAEHPPNPAYRDALGRTALHQAAWGGNSFGIGVMLTGKPPRFDPNLPDKEGKTPLLLAALSPVAKETQEIVHTDADTPQQKNWNAQAHLADELIKSGARLDLVLPGGKSVGELALQAARDANNPQLVSVLSEAMSTLPNKGDDKAPTPAASPAPVTP